LLPGFLLEVTPRGSVDRRSFRLRTADGFGPILKLHPPLDSCPSSSKACSGSIQSVLRTKALAAQAEFFFLHSDRLALDWCASAYFASIAVHWTKLRQGHSRLRDCPARRTGSNIESGVCKFASASVSYWTALCIDPAPISARPRPSWVQRVPQSLSRMSRARPIQGSAASYFACLSSSLAPEITLKAA